MREQKEGVKEEEEEEERKLGGTDGQQKEEEEEGRGSLINAWADSLTATTNSLIT